MVATVLVTAHATVGEGGMCRLQSLHFFPFNSGTFSATDFSVTVTTTAVIVFVGGWG